jgi:MoxR-like ATPase
MTALELSEVKQFSERIGANIAKVIVGKDNVAELVIAAFFAGGHVLLEDVPGTGKTMLAKSLAKSVGIDFKRVQFTPDLLPSDLTGINYFNQKQGDFLFRMGPAFTNILLADEINRATPRTQSSLLECMEEKQITVDGTTYKLAEPYFVIATQNPIETQGTFPLPEAQLDRFLLKTSIGYPGTEEAADILHRFINKSPFEDLKPVCTSDEVISAKQSIQNVYISNELMKYIIAIVEKTRTYQTVTMGVSPRGSLAMLRCAQAFAAIRGRNFVTPEDIKYLAPFIFAHRIMRDDFRAGRSSAEAVINAVVEETEVPTEKWDR